MRTSLTVAAIITSVALFGCASSEVKNVESSSPGYLPMPDRILVYDVAATPADVAENASVKERVVERAEEQTEEEIALGRELGSIVAARIVERLTELGLPAMRAIDRDAARPNDLIVQGEFVGIDEGSKAKRMLIGFGAGSAEVETHLEVYRMTPTGREYLGEVELGSEGGKMPGMLLSMGVGGLARGAAIGGSVAMAKEFGPESVQAAAERTADEFIELLKPRLAKRGWIEED